jgi:anti-sigma regulatory factor (Ser/Thr protein kinase)
VSDREPALRSEHLVVFYEEQDELVDAVTEFVTGAGPHATTIVVATPAHREALVTRIPDARFIDAETLLSSFCEDGVVDPDAFRRSVGDLVATFSTEGQPVRIFGEMVAVLWERGLVAQAIEVEALWTELAETLPFALLCAYPSTLVLDHDEPSVVNDVCALHSGVMTTSKEETFVRAFASQTQSIRACRRFVAAALSDAPVDDVDKLLLIVSELATNAVQHAATPFVVEVIVSPKRSCVSVRDRSKEGVGTSATPMDSETGRGLNVVDALSDEWGVRWTAQGKVVWAALLRADS